MAKTPSGGTAIDDMGRVDRRKRRVRCALKHLRNLKRGVVPLHQDWLALLAIRTELVLLKYSEGSRRVPQHRSTRSSQSSEDRITDGGLLPEQLLKILARRAGADLTLYDQLNDEIIGR